MNHAHLDSNKPLLTETQQAGLACEPSFADLGVVGLMLEELAQTN